MPSIQLRTGKTIYISTYDYYFRLKEDEVDLFFQSCEADDLGIDVEDPFSNRIFFGVLDIEDKKVEEGIEDKLIENPDWDISI